MNTRAIVMIVGLSAVASSTKAAAEPDPVTQWNLITLEGTRGLPPPAQTRVLALVHAAMFDAANGADRRFAPYLVDLRAPQMASGAAALASAAHTILLGLVPERRAALDEALLASMGTLTSTAVRDAGISFGRRIGAEVLARREHDGASAARPYRPSEELGAWRATPPGNLPALLPHWGEVHPFLIAEPARFAPPAPPALGSARYARDLAEVQRVGSRDRAQRSPDQTAAAVFWTGFASPIWSSAARQALARRPALSLVERARVFALMSGAMADAAVVGWAAKFRHATWRPVTGIRLAATDGNAATKTDASWEPLVTTPPFPCYVSGHAIAAGAAQRSLAIALHEDRFDLQITNPDVGLTRAYSSFSQLAQEAHEARIWAGVHFRISQEAGLRAGQRIGEAAATTRLQPLRLSRATRP